MNKATKYFKEVSGYTSTNIDYRCQNVCNIKINDLGLYQCFDCRAIFSLKNKHDRQYIILCLKYRHDNMWPEYFKQLKEIRRLVVGNNFQLLRTCKHSYEKNNEKTIERMFYEKLI